MLVKAIVIVVEFWVLLVNCDGNTTVIQIAIVIVFTIVSKM